MDLLLAKGKSGEIYNIGSGDRRSNIDVARLILNLLAKSESLITFVEDRKGHDVRYSLDSTKIQAEIGWKAEIDFEDGIKALLNFELSRSGAN